LLNCVARLASVGAKLRWSEGINLTMPEAVARQFMATIVDFPDQSGKTVCDPSQYKESSFHLMAVEDIQQSMAVLHHTAWILVPGTARYCSGKRLYVKIVFEIHCEDVDWLFRRGIDQTCHIFRLPLAPAHHY